MWEITADTATDYLRRTQRIPAEKAVTIIPLAWGVSNCVLRVEAESALPFVLKQSRSRLRTVDPWFSRLDRIFREAEVLRWLSARLPPGVVPQPLFEDRENFVLAMEAIRPDHVVWKQLLLEGAVDLGLARRIGGLLGTLHAESAAIGDELAGWQNREVFEELRIEPFYRRLITRHPEVAPALERLIAETFDCAICLVHADFSPKNILIHPDGVSLVDFETAHLGDPAFDLGFFFSHLLLKAVFHHPQSGPLLDVARVALTGWRERVKQSANAAELTSPDLSERAAAHTVACLLARIDGASPVDYLVGDESRQEFVRQHAIARLRRAQWSSPEHEINELAGALTAATFSTRPIT
jgi:5-methylthioribose kinase